MDAIYKIYITLCHKSGRWLFEPNPTIPKMMAEIYNLEDMHTYHQLL